MQFTSNNSKPIGSTHAFASPAAGYSIFTKNCSRSICFSSSSSSKSHLICFGSSGDITPFIATATIFITKSDVCAYSFNVIIIIIVTDIAAVVINCITISAFKSKVIIMQKRYIAVRKMKIAIIAWCFFWLSYVEGWRKKPELETINFPTHQEGFQYECRGAFCKSGCRNVMGISMPFGRDFVLYKEQKCYVCRCKNPMVHGDKKYTECSMQYCGNTAALNTCKNIRTPPGKCCPECDDIDTGNEAIERTTFPPFTFPPFPGLGGMGGMGGMSGGMILGDAKQTLRKRSEYKRRGKPFFPERVIEIEEDPKLK